MNKIYKLIWCAKAQAYVVVSELAKKSGKTLTVLCLLTLGMGSVQAACVDDASSSATASGSSTCSTTGTTYSGSGGTNYTGVIQAIDTATLNASNVTQVTLQTGNYDAVAALAKNGGTLYLDDIKINTTGDHNHALVAYNSGSKVYAGNVDIINTTTTASAYSYGLLAYGGEATINGGTIKMDGSGSASYLHAVRSYNGGTVNISGDLNIQVSGNSSTGLYASGDSAINLGNANTDSLVTVTTNGTTTTGLWLGKTNEGTGHATNYADLKITAGGTTSPAAVIMNGSDFQSYGNTDFETNGMASPSVTLLGGSSWTNKSASTITTTGSLSPGVLLQGGSTWDASNASASTKITASNSAIVYSGGTNNTATLHDADIKTTSTTSDLIVASSGNTGTALSLNGASKLFMGESSSAYLVNVLDATSSTSVNYAINLILSALGTGTTVPTSNSDFTLNASDTTSLTGSITKSTDAALTVNLNDDSVWNIQGTSGSLNTIQKMTQLNINGGTVNAYDINNHSGAANYTITADNGVTNAGTISLHDGIAGDILTIDGNYAGNNGTLLLDTEIGGSSSNTDKLVITGNATGNTTVVVTNTGGLGAQTTGDGIELVNVGGTSASNAFNLFGTHVDAGAYEYYLYMGDASGTGDDWYLRSKLASRETTYRKEVPLYSSIGSQLRGADMLILGDMHKRIGETPLSDDRAAWGRIIASRSKINESGAANAQSSGDYSGIQLGSDVWRGQGWRLGGYMGYLNGNLDVDGFAGGVNGYVGNNTTKSYFLGAYTNRTWDNGTYVDLVLQGARHRTSVDPDNSTGASSQKGYGLTASVEVGKPFALGSDAWKLEPQAQIMHQWLNLDDSKISGSTTVSQSHNDAWLFRLGARIKGEYTLGKGKLEPYARANFYYSPNGADQTTFTTSSASTTLYSGGHHASTELALGSTYSLNEHMKFYGEMGHTWSNGGQSRVNNPISGSVGLRMNW